MRYCLATILMLCLVSLVLCPSPVRAAAAPTRADEQGAVRLRHPVQRQGPDRLARSGDHGPAQVRGPQADEKAKQLARDAEDLKKHWRVDSGEIVNDGQGAYLTTDKDYGDVEFYVDFKIGPKGDSGVYLRGTPQVQIWDFTEPQLRPHGRRQGLGRPLEQQPRQPRQGPLDRWPTSRSASGTPSGSSRLERGPRFT